MNILSQTNSLLQEQIQTWELAKKNYEGLEKVKTKEFILEGGARIKVQFNPERIRSSAAKVDVKSIQKRPCFLCESNRPKEQNKVLFNKHYEILVNPFPIFPRHLTIPAKKHIEQLLENHFDSMLKLAKELVDFTIFYNGPKCGASAPDHFHFQAGNNGFMPIEQDFKAKKFIKDVIRFDSVELYVWKNYHRGIISLKSKSKEHISGIYNKLNRLLNKKQDDKESMQNVLVGYENEEFIVHLFPRKKHRPDMFFATGDEQILISPASVDMGGVFVTPRKEDFEKIKKEDFENIYKQVCIDELEVQKIIDKLIAIG